MPSTKITLTKGTVSRTHIMDFAGMSGAILWILLGCLYLFTFAFSTTYWNMNSSTSLGLWTFWIEGPKPSASWVQACQAMACLGLISLVAAVTLAFVYMMFHQVDKNLVLYGIAGSSFATGLFLFLTIVIWGAKASSDLHISYAFAVISTILALGGGGLAILQIRNTMTAPADTPQY